MSALLFILEPQQVVIASDSLCCTVDRRPLSFTSKIHPIPHLGTVMCGTGRSSLMTHWLCTIYENVIARGIEALVDMAESQLRVIDQHLKEAQPDAVDLTTTVYHFGYSRTEERFVGYAHRSVSGYRAERLADVFGAKPALRDMQAAVDALLTNGATTTLVDLMEEQKDTQTKVPASEWVGIGGEVHLCVVRAPPFTCRLSVCHEFADAADAWQAILDRLDEAS